ncbi:MAG: DUF3857 domain-containing protein, partial [bacterium]|nr:DUF3857 domain-containing protein [bacterium]
MQSCAHRFVATTLAMIAAISAGALELERKAPPEYELRLAPMLTPVEHVLSSEVAGDDEAGGVILLDESIRLVREDGGRIRVIHRVYKAFTEAGAKGIARIHLPYPADLQQPHLLVARTIRPDGTRIDVAPEAAFV